MNWQEAKEVIEENRPRKCRLVDGILKGGFIDDESQKGKAYSMAIEALESMPEYERLKKRDRPYRPTPDNKFYGKGVCKCGAVFLTKDTNFCGNCGQRLDWSEEVKEVTE